MLYIKDVLKASVCSFCENIYEYNSIDENDFVKLLKYYLTEDDLQECLICCTEEIAYDSNNIDNIYTAKQWKKEQYNYDNMIIDICKKAFINTLHKDKTINVEAFVDNLIQNFTV